MNPLLLFRHPARAPTRASARAARQLGALRERGLRLLSVATVLVCERAQSVWANPEGMTVVRGAATAQAAGGRLSIAVGQLTFLDWRSFNIQPGELTQFLQPSANAIVFNRINDSNPSQIWGGLTANGTVILGNAHGFSFGPNSFIQVGGSFVATTAPLSPDMTEAASWEFSGSPPLASIVNYGVIEAGRGQSLFLLAEHVENHGTLQAAEGNIGLHAGKEVLLSERPDGRGLSASVRLPSGSVDNSGRIVADAGQIALSAQVVNQNGLIQADSVRERNGVIELLAAAELALGGSSQLLARGGNSGASAGGSVTLKSGGTFQDAKGGEVVVTGGAHGGNGGQVEVSAPKILSLESRMDASAQSGFHGGTLLLDPEDIILAQTGDGDAGTGTVNAGDGAGALRLNVTTAFANKNFSAITLQATHDITLAQGTLWDLSVSTGVSAGQLTLQAGNNLIFENNARLYDANHWSVRLEAGTDFAAGAVRPGVGSIFLNGGPGLSLSGSVETAHGSIAMTAGDSILVGTGYIRTAGGGDVHLQALSGDIDAGKKNDNYDFTIAGYRVSVAGLGGIATAAGGNVALEAGHDIVSIPTVPAGQNPGASGAYGAEPGDVTLVAGHGILGNFLVRNGVGTLEAGVRVVDGHVTDILQADASIGTATKPVSLSLVSGSWNAFAARDIFINEVRNPSGTFNRNRQPVPPGLFPGNIDDTGVTPAPARTAFLFDYAPNAAANFWAGNSITLLGANLPRITGQNQSMPPIYPPRLSLNAGAGGIDVRNSIILYPSSQGALSIVTRAGGTLSGRQQQATLTGITMSDSGLPDAASFAQGHAVTPWHLHDTEPVRLDISGNIENFGLTIPTFAAIQVAHDTYNFGFLGQNLSASAVTQIQVGGDIRYRGNLTSVTVTEPLPVAVLDPGLSANPLLALKFRFDPATGKLTFIGQMTDNELTFLLNPRILWFDAFGRPLDENGHLIDAPGVPQGTVPVALTAAQQATLRQLHDDSQSATLGDQGLAIAGPGRFVVSAQNADLGISGGINVLAPSASVIPISPYSANLELNIGGNLDMTSTRISNEGYLGGIQLSVGGKLDVGGQFTTFGDASSPKGILTLSGGNVSVVAQGDVNVNGSRIAAYNGGNISVRSEHGDVNAGSGGAGYVSLRALELDPATGQLIGIPATIPGSGILATTLPGGNAALGNITVNTPAGSINASLGGIIQLAFNDANTRNNFIDLHTGKDINAGGSGIIGSNIKLDAGGNVNGLIIGSQNVDIHSQQSVNVTAFSGGGVSISAAGSVSGTVIGGGNVNVSGDSISAALISKDVSTSGDSSGAPVGVPASNVAKSDTKVDDAAATTAQANEKQMADDSEQKRKPAGLAQKVGRVTVILPGKRP